MTNLFNENGDVIDKQPDIVIETALFYTKLYQPQNVNVIDEDLNSYVNDIEIPKLSREQLNSMEVPITLKQASFVLKKTWQIIKARFIRLNN